MTEWLHATALKIKALVRRRRLDEDLEDELAFHLAMKAERESDRRFGNPTLVKETVRDQWTFATLETVMQDCRHAIRALRKSPGFTAVAALSLAIGIGANTSIFTVFNALFLRSLPVRDPQELRILNWTGKGGKVVQMSSGYGSSLGGVRTFSSFSYEAFQQIESLSDVFTQVGGFARSSTNVVARSPADIASTQLVSGGYFETLGAQAVLGRTLQPADDSPGAPPVAVIGWRLYQRLFAGEPSALGSEIRIDRTPYTVVGVLSPNLNGIIQTSPLDVYVPIARAEELSPYYVLHKPTHWWVQIVARVKPGVADSRVGAAVDVVLNRVFAGQTDTPRAIVIDGRTGLAFLNKDIREFLLTLMAMVGLVLVIACANLANLLIARGTARQREIAVRQSLGAGRFRVVRYLLTEAFLLAFAGGVLGLLLAQGGTALLTWMLFPDSPADVRIRPDYAVLAFTAGLSVLTALLFGVLPALRSTRIAPAACLKQGGAGSGTLRQRLARTLIVVQVALALILVVGAGLFARTLVNLGNVDLGFRPGHLLIFGVDANRNGYKDQALVDVYRRIQENVGRLPGVHAVTLTRTPLLAGSMSNDSITIPGYDKTKGEDPSPYVHVVGDRFLTIMGTPILLGRDLDASDNETSPKVAVINATMAKKFFGGNPVGREFAFGGQPDKPIRIVGVAGDAKYDSIRREIPPTVYVHYAQQLQPLRGMYFQLRTSVEPLSLAGAVRRVVAGVDSTLPVAELRTQDQLVTARVSRERTFAILAAVFSGIALILACIGIYGVLAYTVTRRTSEFGIRLALGASGGQIRWLVMRGTLILVAVAVMIGVPAALAIARLVESRLFGVKPADALTLSVSALAIATAVALAAWIPSDRAARSDPSVALRYE
jgi:predicted permease